MNRLRQQVVCYWLQLKILLFSPFEGFLAVVFPRVLAYPFAVLAAWVGATLIFRGFGLAREARRRQRTVVATATADARTQAVDDPTRNGPPRDAGFTPIHKT